MKKLILIGNAPLNYNLIRWFDKTLIHINNADYVIRMNACKNIGWRTGKRIDILGLINRGTPANEFAVNKIRLGKNITNNVKEVWFTRPSENDWEGNCKVNSYYKLPEDVSKNIISKQFLNNKNEIKLSFISATSFFKLLTIVNKHEEYKYEPSTGLCIIDLLITSKKFADYEKFIIGFTWKGWAGHNWKLEKEYLYYLHEKRLINLTLN